MLRVTSLNVNGIRAAFRKGLPAWLEAQKPHIVCMQEIKISEPDLTPDLTNPGQYHGHFHHAQKKGYSGVGIYAKRKPKKIIREIGLPLFDSEGRYLELMYDNISIVSIYLPSGSSGEERQTFKFEVLDYLMPYLKKRMEENLPMILCGDMNIAHKEIDLKNYKGNKKNSGFLPEERQWMTDLFDLEHIWHPYTSMTNPLPTFKVTPFQK